MRLTTENFTLKFHRSDQTARYAPRLRQGSSSKNRETNVKCQNQGSTFKSRVSLLLPSIVSPTVILPFPSGRVS